MSSITDKSERVVTFTDTEPFDFAHEFDMSVAAYVKILSDLKDKLTDPGSESEHDASQPGIGTSSEWKFWCQILDEAMEDVITATTHLMHAERRRIVSTTADTGQNREWSEERQHFRQSLSDNFRDTCGPGSETITGNQLKEYLDKHGSEKFYTQWPDSNGSVKYLWDMHEREKGSEPHNTSAFLDEYGSGQYWLEDGISKEELEWRKGLAARKKEAKRCRNSVYRIACYLSLPESSTKATTTGRERSKTSRPNSGGQLQTRIDKIVHLLSKTTANRISELGTLLADCERDEEGYIMRSSVPKFPKSNFVKELFEAKESHRSLLKDLLTARSST